MDGYNSPVQVETHLPYPFTHESGELPCPRPRRRCVPSFLSKASKIDWPSPLFINAGGDLVILGTAGNDNVTVTFQVVDSTGFIRVTDNGVVTMYPRSQVPDGDILYYGYRGNDYFRNDTSLRTFAWGHDGDDILLGGSNTDVLDGGNGNDCLYGRAGNDILLGRTGNDRMYGGAGNDRAWGHEGNDFIDGGVGIDWADGGPGLDAIINVP